MLYRRCHSDTAHLKALQEAEVGPKPRVGEWLAQGHTAQARWTGTDKGTGNTPTVPKLPHHREKTGRDPQAGDSLVSTRVWIVNNFPMPASDLFLLFVQQ